jgi:gamma-glutamylcyclotransferase (GGCT)/AIG2-like uncharacterized protein YtfP
MNKFYIAYGSNLNLLQMGKRCPTAKVIGTTMLDGWQLTFRGVATIEPKPYAQTPVAIWEIDKDSEYALDLYEGYPRLYRKETMPVNIDGKTIQAMVYIMNSGKPCMPSKYYFDVIRQGYIDTGLNENYLFDALKDTARRIK